MMERLLPDDLVVSTELRHGTVFSCLVEASAHACLLVLQHRDPRHDGRSHLLPTIHSVVASAHCPVLVVPYGYREGRPVQDLGADGIVPSVDAVADLVRYVAPAPR